MVYCNYGREEDYRALKQLNIELQGRIFLLRYGQGSRTAKVHRAEMYGAGAVVMYTDPEDNSVPGQQYPNGYTGNRFGVQRGTVNRLNGDALSLGYPSKDGYYRLDESLYNETQNPRIPSQPISALHAIRIFSYFADDPIEIPPLFKGSLPIYRLRSGRNFTLTTDIEFKTKSTYTTCATIYGHTEKDRFVLLGNHRDGWVYGAADPSSGTATMMEITRALSLSKQRGWRPLRSIMACSWGAEEGGTLASYEWADEHRRFLTDNVVAYLNIDMAVEGNFTVRLRTVDSLAGIIKQAAKNIQSAESASKSLYEDWREKSAIIENKPLFYMHEPRHSILTSGSDYKALWLQYGVTCADFRYYFNKAEFPNLSQNPQYHTRYDSFDWIKTWVDPNFTYHQTIGRLMLASTLLLADKTLVQLNALKYVEQVKRLFIRFQVYYTAMLKIQGIELDLIKKRLEVLLDKATSFQLFVDHMTDEQLQNNYLVRMTNDKLMKFERSFLVPNLVRKIGVNHVVYGTTFFKIRPTKFPGVSEAIYFAVRKNESWDRVRKQLTLLLWCIDTAVIALEV